MCSDVAALTVNEKLAGLSSSRCNAFKEDLKCTERDKAETDIYCLLRRRELYGLPSVSRFNHLLPHKQSLGICCTVQYK